MFVHLTRGYAASKAGTTGTRQCEESGVEIAKDERRALRGGPGPGGPAAAVTGHERLSEPDGS